MEEELNPRESDEQIAQEKPTGLMPGQDHEDDLDFFGAVLFAFFKNFFSWIKRLFSVKKVE